MNKDRGPRHGTQKRTHFLKTHDLLNSSDTAHPERCCAKCREYWLKNAYTSEVDPPQTFTALCGDQMYAFVFRCYADMRLALLHEDYSEVMCAHLARNATMRGECIDATKIITKCKEETRRPEAELTQTWRDVGEAAQQRK